MVHKCYNQFTIPPEREKQDIKYLTIPYAKGFHEQLQSLLAPHNIKKSYKHRSRNTKDRPQIRPSRKQNTNSRTEAKTTSSELCSDIKPHSPILKE